MLGFSDRTNHRLLQLKACQFLWEKRLLVKTDEEIEQIRMLAKRLGIEPFKGGNQEEDPLHIGEIIEGICQKTFQNQEVPYDFFRNFFKQYRAD